MNPLAEYSGRSDHEIKGVVVFNACAMLFHFSAGRVLAVAGFVATILGTAAAAAPAAVSAVKPAANSRAASESA